MFVSCSMADSANVGSRKASSQVVTFGMATTPPMTDRTASAPIAAFIGGESSAMWCSGPGKPTSVSSTSSGPMAGL